MAADPTQAMSVCTPFGFSRWYLSLWLLSILLWAACSKQTDKAQEKQQAAKATPDAGAQAALPPKLVFVGGAENMRQMKAYSEELKRRIKNQVGLAGPVRVLVNLAEQMPQSKVPSQFVKMTGEMKKQAQALLTHSDKNAQFKALVQSCIACHREYAASSLPQIKALIETSAHKP